MLPERLEFLSRFDYFYNAMINAVKEDKINEKEFYLVMIAKLKAMKQERRERNVLLNEEAK